MHPPRLRTIPYEKLLTLSVPSGETARGLESIMARRIIIRGNILRYARPAAILVASIVLAIVAFVVLSASQPRVTNGQPVSTDNGTYAVTGVTYDAALGAHTATLLFDASAIEEREYAVAIVQSAQNQLSVLANGVELTRKEGHLSESRQIAIFDLPPTTDIFLEVRTVNWSGSDTIYVGSIDSLHQSFFLLNSGFRTCALTMLVVMIFYALSLFFAKRSETYLMPFVAYAAFLVVWIAIANTPSPGFLASRMLNLLQICGHFYVAYIPSAICILLVGLKPNSRLWPLLRWYCLLFIPMGLGVLAYVTNFGIVMTIATTLCLAAAGFVLVRGSANKTHYDLALLVGFGITMGFKLAAILVDVGLLEDGVILYAMRKARFLNVPIVMCIMLHLNHMFAQNFRKTEELNATLEEMVRQRTENLERQQSMRQGMMVNIFHDLRGPLFTIQKCVEALSISRDDPGAHGAGGGDRMIVDILQDRTQFLSHLTEDLFTAAKLEDDDCLLAEDPVDLCDEMSQVIQACGPLAAERQVHLRLRTDDDSSAAEEHALLTWGDRSYLSRAFENLLANALQHAPAGSEVLVRIGRQGDQACVSVHNWGDAISPKEQEHIFERYYQRNEKAPKGSSGIGLSIVQAVAQRHRGSVGLTSDGQAGTTFTMRLPVYEPDDNRPHPDLPQSPAPATS